MEEVKLLLADVDGTLVTEQKVLTERAIAAVHRLHDAGIHFAVTSGRPPRGMAMLVEPLHLQGVIAGFNGGVYVKPDLSVLETRTLEPSAAQKTAKLMLDRGLDVWVYTADQWLLRRADVPHSDREQWTVKFPPVVVADLSDGLHRAVKITGVSDDKALMERVEKEAQDALGDTASAARSQPYYLDVTHPEANKGSVVRYLSRTLGIKPESIATIGDQPNDISMFRVGGLSIAMGQSSDEVKHAATKVTDGYNDEGFAKGVERFILGEG